MSATAPETPLAPAEPVLDGRWRKRSLLSFGVAVAILAVFLSRLEVDFGSIAGAVRTSDGRLVALAFAVHYLTFLLRAFRWRLLLQNAGVGATIPSVIGLVRMIFLSWFANCVIPAKLGDAYRGYQIKQSVGISFSTAMGTIVAERLLDTLVLVGLLLVAAWNLGGASVAQSEFAHRVIAAGVLLLTLGALSLGAMWALRDKLHLRLPDRVQAQYVRFQEGTLTSFKRLAAIAPLSVGVWLGEAGRLFIVAQAMGLGLGFPFVIFLALANSFLTVVPFTPGGLGLVEAGVVGLLLLAGIDKETAVAAALIDRSISYWSIIALGLPLFLSRRRI